MKSNSLTFSMFLMIIIRFSYECQVCSENFNQIQCERYKWCIWEDEDCIFQNKCSNLQPIDCLSVQQIVNLGRDSEEILLSCQLINDESTDSYSCQVYEDINVAVGQSEEEASSTCRASFSGLNINITYGCGYECDDQQAEEECQIQTKRCSALGTTKDKDEEKLNNKCINNNCTQLQQKTRQYKCTKEKPSYQCDESISIYGLYCFLGSIFNQSTCYYSNATCKSIGYHQQCYNFNHDECISLPQRCQWNQQNCTDRSCSSQLTSKTCSPFFKSSKEVVYCSWNTTTNKCDQIVESEIDEQQCLLTPDYSSYNGKQCKLCSKQFVINKAKLSYIINFLLLFLLFIITLQ